MKILLDHNVPLRLRIQLAPHEVRSTRQMRWEQLANGSLLRAAGSGGFDVFLTVDKNIEHQQDLKSLPLPVVLIDAPRNTVQRLTPFAPAVLKLLDLPLRNILYFIEKDGRVVEVSAPRRKR